MSHFHDIITEKCPKCGEGQVFETKGNVFLFRMPKMYKTCSCCGHHFHKETGYFFGAMYVSYALAVAEMVALFIVMQFFTKNFGAMIGGVAVMAVVLSMFNFRLSRMLWIYMFDGRDRNL
ncbi:DUF983 domain-containing protein [Flavobacterium sp. RHBU_3]|uniref:DUF983 domain-containing protein n=1 Tax=Flavobacterium sp. RHBU_3 TaxID=3391184 RepID=UPI003984654A